MTDPTRSRKHGARRPRRSDKPPRRDSADWLRIARSVLIEEGIDRVKVEPLAELLGVTTGSFYHHFRNRDELLLRLLADWEASNSDPIFKAVEAVGDNPTDQMDALLDMFIRESEYDPQYDSAVRAWAHNSKAVEKRVRRVDDQRIALLKRIFIGFGYDEQRAFIRARITYFHQVGYQATEITETAEQRRALLPLYQEALVGTPPPLATRRPDKAEGKRRA